MLTYDGKYWKVPAGPTPWTLDTTAKWGKGVKDGIPDLGRRGAQAAAEGRTHPCSSPLPARRTTVRFCAKEGVTPILPPMLPVYEEKLYSVYAEVSGKPKGQGVGVLRDVIIAATDAEAMALWRDSGQFSGRAWFEPFVSAAACRIPRQEITPLQGSDRHGLCLCRHGRHGAARNGDQQKRQPVDWVFCYTYNSLVPHPVLMKVDREIPGQGDAALPLRGWRSIMGMLSDKELADLVPAWQASSSTPVPTQLVSSDEYLPIAQTERQKKVEAHMNALGDDMAARTACRAAASSRTAAGMTTAYLANERSLRPAVRRLARGGEEHRAGRKRRAEWD